MSKIIVCFSYGAACVILRIAFIFRSVVGDALDYDFGIVATGESAFCEGPIALGLAFVFSSHCPLPFLGVAYVSRCLGRVFLNREIARHVDRIAFLARLDNKLLGELPVGESR